MIDDRPEIIIGEIINSRIHPWVYFPNIVKSVIISSYEFIKNKGLLYRIEKRGGMREYLKLHKNIQLWIDSGGFQIMRKGIRVRIEKIAQIYERIDADIYISLDYPTLPTDGEKERRKKIEKNKQNFDFLYRRFPDKKIIPVIHFAPSLEEYDELLKFYIDEYDLDIIAFGGFVPPLMSVKGTKKSRLKGILALKYVATFMKNNVHVMGIGAATTISILKALNIKSTDSAAWRVKAAYGKIILPWGGERHVSNREINFGRKKLSQDEFQQLIQLIRTHDSFPFQEYLENIESYLEDIVFKNFEMRAIFNAWIVLTLAKRMHPKTGTFKTLYRIAEHVKHMSAEDIKKIWHKIDHIKQSELINFIQNMS